jgi:hypothetical protein
MLFPSGARYLLSTVARFVCLVGLWIGLVPGARAQTGPPRTYEFLTMTTFESQAKVLSHIYMTPAFQGKSDIQLEDFGGISASKNMDKLQRNTTVINQQLEAITAAGWELTFVYTITETGTIGTRYLFKKAK